MSIWINTFTTLATTLVWIIIPLAKDNFGGDDEVKWFSSIVLVTLSLVFFFGLIFTIRLAYLCTIAVPTDILVVKQREMWHLSKEFKPVWEDTGDPMDLFCSICNAYVQERTKHCGACNRCCEEFDHHCNWLNNCIGTENYQSFKKLIRAYLTYHITSMILFI